MQLNDATRIIEVIDQRIRKWTQSESRVETTWGTVAAVDATKRYADVYLYGNEAPYASEYFRMPDGLDVTVGDSVKVAIDTERGDRWVEEVHYLPTYRKMAVDAGRGQIKLGNGSAAPAFGTAGQAIKVNAAGTALEYGSVDIATDPFAPTRVHISATDDIGAATSATDPLRIGPSSGQNIAIDSNEVMARNNGAATTLHVNAEGGDVTIGNNVTGNSQGKLTALGASGGPIPVGGIIMWGTTSAPAGYLVCDGSAVSRTTYERLYAVIGNTFGAGDGSTTFNLPNLKQRVPVGRDSANTSYDGMGETGGAATHTHGGHSNHVVTQPSDHPAQAHSAHTGTAVSAHASHSHETPFIDNGAQTLSTTQAIFGSGTSRTRDWTGSYSAASGSYPVADTQAVTVAAHTVTQPSAHSDHAALAHSGTAVDAHSAHDSQSNYPPFIVLNFVIKF